MLLLKSKPITKETINSVLLQYLKISKNYSKLKDPVIQNNKILAAETENVLNLYSPSLLASATLTSLEPTATLN